jgi:hypothetical protein
MPQFGISYRTVEAFQLHLSAGMFQAGLQKDKKVHKKKKTRKKLFQAFFLNIHVQQSSLQTPKHT